MFTRPGSSLGINHIFTCGRAGGPEAGDGHQGRPTEVDFGQLLVVVGTTVEGVGRAAHADVQQVAIHLQFMHHERSAMRWLEHDGSWEIYPVN